MSLRESLFRHLQQVARGKFADADCYPLAAVPKKPPQRFVTYQRVSSTHIRHLRGGSGLVSSRWQVDCWARYASDADRLYDAIRRSLDNRTGDFGDADNPITLNASFLEDDAEDFVPPIDASQQGRARVRMDFIIWHPESVTPGT